MPSAIIEGALMKKILLIIFALFILLVGGIFAVRTWNQANAPEPVIIPSSMIEPIGEPDPEENETAEPVKVAGELPNDVLLKVPFTPQAPTANWDELHNEACEEASVLMAAAYFNGDTRKNMPASEAEAEIQKLTKYQQEKFGYYLSIDAAELAQMAEEVYGLKAEVVRENISEDMIKRALAEDKLVLVPVNGRQLGNPNFQTPGPIYHMFVIKGYDEKSFITNEPGTKRGLDYRYSYEVIRNALGDYDHKKKETDPSDPAIIILSK